MNRTAASKQFSFRLPEDLVEQVEHCAKQLRSEGLEVTRADVVRLLLKHALRTTRCSLEALLKGASGSRQRD